MTKKPIVEVMEGGAKLAKALNDAGIPVTFGKRSEGNTDLSGVIDLASNNIGTGNIPLLEDIESRIHEELGIPFLTTNEFGTNSLIWDIIEYDYDDDIVKYKDYELVNTDVLTSGLNGKQNTLVSGTNIKTVNNESLLGSGDITITGVNIGTFTDLQTLITSTSSGGTIILDKDYKYDSTTDSNLTNGITINKNITIIGNGHIIDGNNTKRAFYINGQYTFNLSDVRIQNCSGSGYNGGAILTENGAIVNINNTLFNKNNAHSGGAIYTQSNCNLTLINCTFNQNNTIVDGGAIYATSSAIVNINNTTFKQNNATSSGGAIYVYGATVNTNNVSFNQNNATTSGGAIYATNSATVNTNNVSFNQNIANNGFGGAMYCNGTLTMTDCTFKDNTANNYVDIYSNNVVTVYDCIIPNIATSCHNVTNKPYLTDHQSLSSKQDLLVSGTNIATINNQSLLNGGNITIQAGADIGTFSDLQDLIDNASSGNTIILDKDYKYDPTTDSSLSTGIEIDKNITIIGNGHIIDGNNNARAFYINQQTAIVTLSDIRIQNCINSNYGGAIYATSGGAINITNTIFNQNTATYDGGAIYAENGATVNITNTTFNQNTAIGGGAIYAEEDVVLTLKNSNFKNNTATNYANIYSYNEIIVYDCIIPNIATSCYNVTNITTESLVDMIGDAIAYINK